MHCSYYPRIILNTLPVIAVINVWPGGAVREGETLAGILTFGFFEVRATLPTVSAFSESRRQDASRRPLATLRPAEAHPQLINQVLLQMSSFRMTTDSLSVPDRGRSPAQSLADQQPTAASCTR